MTPIQQTLRRIQDPRAFRSSGCPPYHSVGATAMAMNAKSAKVWSGARIKVWPGAVTLATFPRFAGDRVAAFAGRVGVKDPAAFVAFLTEGEECTLSAPQAAFASWRLRGRAT